MRLDGVTVIRVDGDGPEDVLVDAEERIYTGLADGRIIRLGAGGCTAETIATTPGRPLGLEFYGPDELVVCASDHGLLAVSLETGAVRVLVDEVAGGRLRCCNNVAVAADGTLYFSDSSEHFSIPEWRSDMIEGIGTGRLFRRGPGGDVEELLGGLQFANGVALARDESFVTVAETTSCRVRRVWLTGPRAGTSDVFVDKLSGYPDNCSTGSDGLIWVAVASPRTTVLDVVHRMPWRVRSLVRRLPEILQPSPARTVGVVGVSPDGTVVRKLSGEIDGFHMLTGVRERGGTLYFGSLLGRAVAILPSSRRVDA